MQIRVCLETLMTATIPLIVAGCAPPPSLERSPGIVTLYVTPKYICPDQQATIQWLIDGGKHYGDKNIRTYLEIQEPDGSFPPAASNELTDELRSSFRIDVAEYQNQDLLAPRVRLSIEDRAAQPVKLYDEKTTFMSIQRYCEASRSDVGRSLDIDFDVRPRHHCPEENTVIEWKINQGTYQVSDIIARWYLQETISFSIDELSGKKEILLEDYFIDEPLPNVITVRLEINVPGKEFEERRIAIANQVRCPPRSAEVTES